MKYILRIKKKIPKCPKLPIKSQVAPVDGIYYYNTFFKKTFSGCVTVITHQSLKRSGWSLF